MKAECSKVLLIYTGGTIGMISSPDEKSLKPFDFKQITEEVPEINKIKCKIDAVSLKKPVDSSNITPKIWERIGDFLYSKYDDYDGFVVLHGTDTMAYTASAFSFMFENLNKPIIFTGSQLPIGMVRTDGKENLITAIEIAADKVNGKSVVQEVAIYFEYQLYRANRTTKISSDHFEAYKSFNYSILAEAGININYNHNAFLKPSGDKLIYKKGFRASISTIVFYPGIQLKNVKFLLKNTDTKIIILITYGSGNLPIDEQLIKAIKKYINKGNICLNLSQCLAGKVEQFKYETGKQLLDVGVVGIKDMTMEAVFAKSMWLLHKYPNNNDRFVEELLVNKAGEICE